MFDILKNEISAVYYVVGGIAILFVGGVMSDTVTNFVDRIFKR